MQPSVHMPNVRATRPLSALLLALGLLGGALISPPTALAAGVSDAQAKVNRTLGEIESLRDQLGQIDEEFGEATDLKEELDRDIARKQSEVDQMTAELGGAEQVLAQIAVNKFISGGSLQLSPVFANASDYSAAEQRDALSRLALDLGEANVDDIEALLSDLKAARRELDAKRSQAAQLLQFLENKQAEFEALEKTYLSKYQSAQRELGEAELRAEEERRAQAVAQQQRQSRATAMSTSTRTSTRTTAPADIPPVSGKAAIAVRAALSQLGVPYRFAAEDPGVAFDCSGLTKWAWGQAGVYLPHQSGAQYRAVPHVPTSEAQPGDLIFYYTPIGHVGMYIGNGQMVHSPQTGDVVSITTVRWYKVVGVGRPG